MVSIASSKRRSTMSDRTGRQVYLDNHATTPCDPRVIEAMLPIFGQVYANPSSTVHSAGRASAEAVSKARVQVADLIRAHSHEIVFTSGATESNNLALYSVAEGLRQYTTRTRIVTTKIEHRAVLEPCQRLASLGFEVLYVPVDGAGRVDLSAVEELITEDTLLVSIQAASNEIGTIQPIGRLAAMAHERGAFFHTDAAQAVGKVPMNVVELGVDLLSISAHKFYGPKGIGALYVRGGPRSLPFIPLMLGGGQETGIRPGTLNVPGIVGMGKACELCQDLLADEAPRIGNLRDQLEHGLMAAIPGLRRNGDLANRLPNNCSLTFPGLDADALIVNTPDLALSTGSACTSGALEPSYVLQEIGLSRQDCYSSLRIGLGRFTSLNEIDQAVVSIGKAHSYLSPAA
jgi:cysteine desulfurase